MKKNKNSLKYYADVAVIALIGFIVLKIILKDKDIGEIREQVNNISIPCLIAAVVCLFVYVASESLIIKTLLKQFKEKISFIKCLATSSIGFFFCGITPSATGGQPLQVYTLSKHGYDPMVCTLVVTIITMVFKAVLLILFGVLAILAPDTMFSSISEVPILFAIGLLVELGFIVFCALLIRRPAIAKKIVLTVIGWLGKLKFVKKTEKMKEKFLSSMENYEKAAEFFSNHVWLNIGIFAITIVQRVAYFSICYLVYRGLGLSAYSYVDLLALQVALSLSVDVLPLPGASGANEGVFSVTFEGVFGEYLHAGLLLNRGITYYVLMICTGIGVLITKFLWKENDGKKSLETAETDIINSDNAKIE
ncbi:MAG: flippase-like domain-containing protein [Lachnospiraceae bacterium]|nr:flippase-like domain-containing protein [Lachnospiraceae bacterium]